jgi:decaprenyl-phosphate phosphoribosyltransferase
MRQLKAYFQIARPNQYVKNGFVWFPLFFGHKLLDPHALVNTWWAFLGFCLIASSVYILNDLQDVEEDRRHPVKKNRPLASGLLRPGHAVSLMILLLVICVVVVVTFLPREFLLILGAYLVLNILYTFFLKHFAIIDIICIGIGFVLRIFAGGLAADIRVSHWIVLMTFLLALFLALSKRRDDLLLEACGYNPRKCLNGYNLEFVSLSMVIMSSVVIMAYILYTTSPEIIEKHGTNQLYLTSLWVSIGLLRYLQITFVEQRSGSPTLILLKDYFMLAVVTLWFVTFYLMLYINGH